VENRPADVDGEWTGRQFRTNDLIRHPVIARPLAAITLRGLGHIRLAGLRQRSPDDR
jgi:hypothetical protein